MQDSIAARETELRELQSRLEPLRSGTVVPASVEAKEKIDKELAYWECVVKKRKKIRDDVWALIKDALPEDLNAQEIKVNCVLRALCAPILFLMSGYESKCIYRKNLGSKTERRVASVFKNFISYPINLMDFSVTTGNRHKSTMKLPNSVKQLNNSSLRNLIKYSLYKVQISKD